MVASTPLSLMPQRRAPKRWVIAAFVLAVVAVAGGTAWYVENREFMAMHDAMERNEVEFERVDPDEMRTGLHVTLAQAEQTALDTYSAWALPHSQPYLGRITAPHLGRGFEDELVYAVRVKGRLPGPIIQNKGEPEDFVVLLPAGRPEASWSIGLPTEPPYLTSETMR